MGSGVQREHPVSICKGPQHIIEIVPALNIGTAAKKIKFRSSERLAGWNSHDRAANR